MHIVSVAFGFVIGLMLGLLGGGGSILTVPIFVYVLGFGAKESIAMSLAVVGATSLVGAAGHWRLGHVRIQVALVFGVIAMLGTYIGTRLATRLTGAEQLAIFALAIVVAAGVMLSRRRTDVAHMPTGSPGPSSSSFALIAAQALIVGLLTGLVGIGGGFLIVPALVVERSGHAAGYRHVADGDCDELCGGLLRLLRAGADRLGADGARGRRHDPRRRDGDLRHSVHFSGCAASRLCRVSLRAGCLHATTTSSALNTNA